MNRLTTDFLTFLATIDPIGTLTLFVGLTAKTSSQDRVRVALRAIGYSALILVCFVLIGQFALVSLGIRLASFQLAGGIIFFLFGLQMVFGAGAAGPNATVEEGHDIAVFPLAIPSIASPGAILAAVVLTDNRKYSVMQQATTTCVMLAVLAITLVILLQANRIFKFLGISGSSLTVRIMGMILAALAVEMVLEAIGQLAV